MKWSMSTNNILDLQFIVYQLKETRSTLCDTGTDSKNDRDEVKLRWD